MSNPEPSGMNLPRHITEPRHSATTPPSGPEQTGSRLSKRKRAIQRMKEYAARSLDLVHTLVDLAADASCDAGIPGLSMGLAMLAEIIGKIREMKTTIKGVRGLTTRLEGFSERIQEYYSLPRDEKFPALMEARITGLFRTWSEIEHRAQEIKARNALLRFITSNSDARQLEDLVGEINSSLDDFLTQAILNIEENVIYVRLDVKAIKVWLSASFMPTYAKNARYDASSVRRPCLEGTRVGLLNRLRQWIITACARKDLALHMSPGNVYWINGLAGTGKTTIAFTLAEWCRKQGILGASFFCSRFDLECSDPGLIFVTISRQLCHFHAPFKEKVEAVLQEDPDIGHSSPSRQFEELILRPLEELEGSFPISVIVIDALDECRDDSAVSVILAVVAKYVARVAGCVIFIVTSRPEPRIAALFRKSQQYNLADATTSLVLHMAELNSVSTDIRRYIEEGLCEVRQLYDLGEGWPTTEDVDKLVALSNGLFIWAATALLFIRDIAFSNPHGQLHSLIDAHPTSLAHRSILASLYTQIAQSAFTKVSESLKIRLQPILATIALAEEPLSASTLAGILDLPEIDVRYSLVGLSSVLCVPQDPDQPIRVIHPTFPEYLLGPFSIELDAFHITAVDHHPILLSHCFRIMGVLRRNIACIEDPLLFKTEISTLVDDVTNCIPPPLRYACSHWESHFNGIIDVARGADIFEAFREFLTHQVLYWLEACALLGTLDESINVLDMARRRCQTLGGHFGELVPLLVDYHRFTQTFFVCINTAPLQIYHSALAFSPIRSHIKRNYSRESKDLRLMISHGAPGDWGPCIDVFPAHGSYEIYSVAFSFDGNFFATGGQDGRMKIWRTATRTLLLSIGGTGTKIFCIAFSPNGSNLVAGSSSSVVFVWHIMSGEQILVLEGHTREVLSITYSTDGSQILSASNNEIVLWDASDGRRLRILNAIFRDMWQVSLSPTGSIIAHGTEFGVCLYDVASTISEYIPLPSPGRVVAFSPCGRYIAAAMNTSICIWTADDKALLRSMDVPSRPFRLAFSHDGSRIGCGLDDGSIFLWHVEREEPPYILRGHTLRVCEIAWSLDGAQILSVSIDTTVRVWDSTYRPSTDTERDFHDREPPSVQLPHSTLLCRGDGIDIFHLQPIVPSLAHASTPSGAPTISLHPCISEAWDNALATTRPVRDLYMVWGEISHDWESLTGQWHVQLSWRPVDVSHDCSLMAYLPRGSDTEVHICDLRTGEVIAALVGHTDIVRSATFSLDGALVVTGSQDNTVKVWRVSDASLIASHAEHTDCVRATEFSSDARFVVSGSRDRTVRVCDATSGRVSHVLGPHQSTVAKVTFSADGSHVFSLGFLRNIMIWDLVQRSCTYQVSLADNSWPRSLDFTSDGKCILIRDHDGRVRSTIATRNPRKRTWPVYHVSSDGWVTAKSPGSARRLCWLPPGWRYVFSLGDGKFCALDWDQKMSVVFNVS